MIYYICALTSLLYVNMILKEKNKTLNNDNEIYYSKNEKDFVIIDKVINF